MFVFLSIYFPTSNTFLFSTSTFPPKFDLPFEEVRRKLKYAGEDPGFVVMKFEKVFIEVGEIINKGTTPSGSCLVLVHLWISVINVYR